MAKSKTTVSVYDWTVSVYDWGVVGICLCLSAALLATSDKEMRLLEAAKRGDREAVRSLLQEPVQINAAEADGATALHWAAHRDDLEMAQLLIRSGADPNASNAHGVRPLSLACTNRSGGMVRELLQGGADPNASQWSGETALMTCARTGTAEAVKALLLRGADPNSRESRGGQTALMWALSGKHMQVVKDLVELGADVHAASKAGFTPLMFAAQQGDVNSARLLLAAGAEVDLATPQHGTALTIAAASGHQALSLLLLEKGADPNSPDGNGVTPLHYSAHGGLSVLNGLKYDPDYRPAPENMPKLTEALLAGGADPDVRIQKKFILGPNEVSISIVGATPFFLAAVAADVDLMQILANSGADPQLGSEEGITPLMAAAGAALGAGAGTLRTRTGSPEEAVKLAVRLGADVNARSDSGQTAMHAAAFTGEKAIIQFLADRGASVDVSDSSGQTPWTMAMGISPVLRYRGSYGSHPEAAALLLKLGAVPRTREEMDTLSSASKP